MRHLQPNIVTSENTQQTLFAYNSASAIGPFMGNKVALDFDDTESLAPEGFAETRIFLRMPQKYGVEYAPHYEYISPKR